MTSNTTAPKTDKGQHTKELILEKAFRLFMLRGYEKATIAELIAISGMSRGAIFYYAKDKLSLYKAIIDKFILSAEARPHMVKHDENTSLLEFIHIHVRGIDRMLNDYMQSTDYTPVRYFNMLYQAAIYYPEFSQKITEVFHREDETWKKIIQRDIQRGILRKDIDIRRTIDYFRRSYMGLSMEASFTRMLDTNVLLDLYLEIYNAIKK